MKQAIIFLVIRMLFNIAHEYTNLAPKHFLILARSEGGKPQLTVCVFFSQIFKQITIQCPTTCNSFNDARR
jgi:hypothetical protein